jgi:hypothetical protein
MQDLNSQLMNLENMLVERIDPLPGLEGGLVFGGQS